MKNYLTKKIPNHFMCMMTWGVYWCGAIVLTTVLSASSSSIQASDIFYAIDKGDIKRLVAYLKTKGNPDLVDDKGRSLLARAAYRGHLAMTQALLSAGASEDYVDPNKTTALFMACSSKHDGHDDEEALAKIIDLLLSSDQGRSVINHPTDSVTPLHKAAERGHYLAVDELCRAGAKLDIEMKHGETALWLAASRGSLQTVNVLLSHHAAVDHADFYRITPLLISCHKGFDDIVRSLIRYGANINLTRDNGISPLIVASYNGHEEVVKVLLEAGVVSQYCSPLALGAGTAYQYALQENHQGIVELLYAEHCKYRAIQNDRDLQQQLCQLERDRERLAALEEQLMSLAKKDDRLDRLDRQVKAIEQKEENYASELDNLRENHGHRQLERDRARLVALEEKLSDVVKTEDALARQVKAIEKKEENYASELDNLRETQEELLDKQRKVFEAGASFQEMRKRLDEIERSGTSSETILELKNQLAVLVEEHRVKQENERQKQALRDDLYLKVFYETTERTLNQFFVAYKVLDTKMVQRSVGTLGKIGQGISLLGNFISLPFANLVTSAVAVGLQLYEDSVEERHIRFIARLIQNNAVLDEQAEHAARYLTDIYREQLKHLTDKGAETLSKCAVMRFIEYLRAKQLDSDSGLAEQLVRSVVVFKSHQGAIPFTHKTIETIQKKKTAWTDKGIFQKTGIRTEKDELYVRNDGKSEHDTYGFRKGSINDVEILRYQCLYR